MTTKPTLEQLSQMTDEELNVRLAVINGWYVIEPEEGGAFSVRHPKNTTLYPWRQTREEAFEDAPDYCSDANAVAEVRKGLTLEQRQVVCRILYWMLIPKEDQYEDHSITWSILERIANASERELTIAIITELSRP